MADIPMNVTTNIVQRLVDRVIDEASYLCCFKKIVEDFQNEKKTLEAKYTDVLKDIEENKNAVMHIVQEVDLWKKRAEDLIAEDTNTRKSCLFPWCYNCIWQYRRGKDLAEKTQKIKKLIASSNFPKFARPAELPSWEFYASSDFMFFDSRKSVYDKVLAALKNGENYMIALHGTGGSGKTTLAVKVGEIVEKEKHFDRAIMVTVSNNPDVKMIQDQIAKPLGVEFKPEENDLDRAKRLWSRLTNGERVLIVLDDVWKKLKFEDIGIPSAHNHKGCCILITTRDLNVCRLMGCQDSIIKLDILPENEAWIFFQKHSGINDNSPKKLKDIAEKIAKECKGLPVALAALGSTLEGQNPEDWKAALRSLKNPRPIDITDHELKEVYQRLKVSYDFLNNEHAQKLFKLCSLFPEDYEISLEDLTRFSIGLGLFGEIESYTTARDDMHRAKKKLIDCCLLMEVDEIKCVKMHDLIRDVAKVIANNEIHLIVGPKWNQSDIENLGDMRYLYCQNMIDFPEQLPYRKLEILIATIELEERDSIQVPEAFFKGMTNLKVLSLQVDDWRRKFIEFPRSIDLLEGIRTLHLGNSKFEDISVLMKLQRLETLELIRCFINEFSNGITELNKLRLLKLEDCEINRNPLGVIGKLSKIEELYFVGNFGSSWEFTGELVASLFDEDNMSPKLQRYRISLENASDAFIGFRMANSVSKGVGVEQFFMESISNATIKRMIQKAECLCLKNIQRGYKSAFPNLVEAIGGDMNGLTELQLESYSGMECLIDTAALPSLTKTIFSKLIDLQLSRIKDMKELCQGHQIPPNLFEKLKWLYIRDCRELHGMLMARNLNLSQLQNLDVEACPKLTSLFTFSTAKSLLKLKGLRIFGCMELKYIINEALEEGEEIVWDQNEDQLLPPLLDLVTLFDLPNLISIFPESDYLTSPSLKKLSPESSHKARQQDNTLLGIQIPSSELLCSAQCLKKQSLAPWRIKKMSIYNCPKLKSLFTVLVASTIMLEELDIQNCDGLKQIITDGEDYQNHWNNSYIFPKLRSVAVIDCSLLEFIFPAYFSGKLLHLNSVVIYSAPELKYVFGQYHHEHNSLHLDNNPKIQIDLPALESLYLRGTPKIISICQNNFHATWPPLKSLWLKDCPSLSITSISDFMAHYNTRQLDNRTRKDFREILKYLTNLSISKLPKIEGIFRLDELSNDVRHLTAKLESLSLQELPELRYIFMGPKDFFGLQNLKYISMVRCEKLKVVFTISILRSLPQLTEIKVEDCKELEQLVEQDNENQNFSNSQSQSKSLQNLIILTVINCPKLKCLFKCYEFPNLEILIIRGTSKLEEELDCEQCEITEPQVPVMLPKLRYLILIELSKIVEFYQGVNVPYRVVQGCSKLKLTSTTTLEEMTKCKDVQNEKVRTFLNYKLQLIIKFNNEMVGQCAQEDCGSKKAAVAVTSTDSKPGNPLTEPKQTIEASPQILKETQKKIVQSSPASEEPALITSLTASQEIEIETPQEIDHLAKKGATNKMLDKNHRELGETRLQVHSDVEQVHGESRKYTSITGQQSIKENFQLDLTRETDTMVASSSHSDPQVIKETEKDILQNCPAPYKPAMAASSNKTPNISIISDETIKQTKDREGSKPTKAILEELSTQELDEQQLRSEPFSTNQHQPLEVPQTDNIASNVVEEPVDSALKIATSEKSTTLAVSTDFKPKNSTAESLVVPTAEAYAQKKVNVSKIEIYNDKETEIDSLNDNDLKKDKMVIKNSANDILQNFQASKKPAMATSSAQSPSRSAILLQDTTSLVVREPVKSSIAESDAEAIAESKETQAQRTHTQVQERRAIEGSVVEELNPIEEDMKSFYASIEKECSAMPLPENPFTSIESLNVRASEETQRALEILRELLSKKFTLLLHPARSGLMSNVLEYLFSLSPEDGISSTMKPMLEELSRSFRKWSLDYGKANLKLDLANATQSKIEKLEEGLEANIKEFREVAKLENGICSHLAYLEARKRELEAEIADYKSARDTVAERKRQVFEDGKMLKAEKEDLWKSVPQLRDEQECAKTTKASIECAWSKLGQQFMENFDFGK